MSRPIEAASVPPRRLGWRTRAAIVLGGAVVRVLARTWRVRVVGRELLEARNAGASPVIYTLWHGQMLPTLCAHRVRTGVLISEHTDGEIIARIVAHFGHVGVRGSSSRGGTRALLEAVRVVQGGTDMAFTPDGPRGPRHSFAQGPLVVAQRSGAPIVFIVAHADRLWRLRSWDGFEIPKPFARVTVLYTAPAPIDAADARAAAQRTDEFRSGMLAALEAVAQVAAAPVAAPVAATAVASPRPASTRRSR